MNGAAETWSGEVRERAADRLADYEQRVRGWSRKLESDTPNIAWSIGTVADGIDALSDYVRDLRLERARVEAQRLARRRPLVFFGAAIAAGLLAGIAIGGRTDFRSLGET